MVPGTGAAPSFRWFILGNGQWTLDTLVRGWIHQCTVTLVDVLLHCVALQSSLECMGRQSLDTLAAMARNTVAWGQKTEKLFWRGRDSRQERLDLVAMAKVRKEVVIVLYSQLLHWTTIIVHH